ncbi:MAG TPA: DMT family transporter [Ignavibacteriaceae bacterium]|nr:DMT family transporter [Ignavibacteriaceae bacterium]
MKKKLLQFWEPLFAVILWGNSFIATKLALRELNPQTIILLRLIFGIALLVIFAIYTKKDFTLNLKNHGAIFILALIAVFHLWIQVTGLEYTSAASTGWIVGVTPVFMAILSIIFFKEKLSKTKIIGIIVAFSGLILLVSRSNMSNIRFIEQKGDLMVLASAFTWSVYSLVNKKISLKYPPMMTILFLFIMMAVIISPFTVTRQSINAVIHLSLIGWVSILFLGIFCSGIAYVLWAKSLKELEATKVGSFLYLEPFVTVLSAWFILSETITLTIIMSGLIITAGVILVNRK